MPPQQPCWSRPTSRPRQSQPSSRDAAYGRSQAGHSSLNICCARRGEGCLTPMPGCMPMAIGSRILKPRLPGSNELRRPQLCVEKRSPPEGALRLSRIVCVRRLTLAGDAPPHVPACAGCCCHDCCRCELGGQLREQAMCELGKYVIELVRHWGLLAAVQVRRRGHFCGADGA